MSGRRVFIVGDSLFAEGLAKMLAQAQAATLVGIAPTAESASPLIESSRADTIIVTAIGDAADSFCRLITRHPTLSILRADLNANTVQVITSQQVSANVPDLLTALANLSKRSEL